MIRSITAPRLIVLAAATALAAGCSTHSANDTAESATATTAPAAKPASDSPPAPFPTLTDPPLQPPSQDNQYTTSGGRPKVAYDPCTWIPDNVIAKTGYDAKTRKRGDDRVTEQTFLICEFKSSSNSGLTIMSGNVTWDEDLQKNSQYSQPITVNGRQAMWVRDPGTVRGCDIHLRTKVGFVDIATDLSVNAVAQGQKPCDGLLDIATAIEPTIGKDN